MTQYYISTTGTVSPVVIKDLGAIKFFHPVSNVPVLLPTGFITASELQGSADFKAAIDAGELIMLDGEGNSISDPAQAVTPVTYLKDLTDVQITSASAEDRLYFNNTGLIVVNERKPDIQSNRSSTQYSLTPNNSWGILTDLEVTTGNLNPSDYRLTLNLLASVSSNRRSVDLAIFVDGVQDPDITQRIYFDRKNDVKSITIVDRMENVQTDSTINLRVKRSSGSSATTLRIYRRSIFVDQLN